MATLKDQGNQAYGRGEYTKAAKLYREALKADPKATVLYLNRCQCFLKLGDFRRALNDAVAAVNTFDDLTTLALKLKVYYRKGMAFVGLGERKRAHYCFEKAVGFDSGNRDARAQMAQLGNLAAEVPVEVVGELPREFRDMVSGRKNGLPGAGVASGEPLAAAQDEINRLFGSKAKPKVEEVKEAPREEKPKNGPHELVSPFKALAHLRGLGPEQRQQAYQYVLGLSPDEMAMFRDGVDIEFLQFFLEAARDVPSLNENQFLATLQALSQCKRFDLSMAMLDLGLKQAVQARLAQPTPLLN